jgi:molybdopterin-containing oxidoreductase family membrane subunit
VIVLALILRRFRRLSFGNDLVAMLGGLLGVFIAVEAFFLFAEFLTAAYPGAPEEAGPVHRMLTGPYAPLFWFEAIVGLGVPFAILVVRRNRHSTMWVGIASVIAIVGIFVHRLNLLLNGLSFPPIGMPPGVSIGVAQGAGASFAESYWYAPTIVEWLIVGGVLAFGALLLTLAALVLPLDEHGPHHAEPGLPTPD